MKLLKPVLLSAFCLLTTNAFGKTLRPADLSEKELQNFFKGQTSDVIEFREGDQIPVVLKAECDILESTSPAPTMVEVKKGFYLKFEDEQLLMSWDGGDFKPYRDLIAGKLEVKANESSPVSGVDIIFGAFIKN
jgi:hypothetical protein